MYVSKLDLAMDSVIRHATSDAGDANGIDGAGTKRQNIPLANWS